MKNTGSSQSKGPAFARVSGVPPGRLLHLLRPSTRVNKPHLSASGETVPAKPTSKYVQHYLHVHLSFLTRICLCHYFIVIIIISSSSIGEQIPARFSTKALDDRNSSTSAARSCSKEDPDTSCSEKQSLWDSKVILSMWVCVILFSCPFNIKMLLMRHVSSILHSPGFLQFLSLSLYYHSWNHGNRLIRSSFDALFVQVTNPNLTK